MPANINNKSILISYISYSAYKYTLSILIAYPNPSYTCNPLNSAHDPNSSSHVSILFFPPFLIWSNHTIPWIHTSLGSLLSSYFLVFLKLMSPLAACSPLVHFPGAIARNPLHHPTLPTYGSLCYNSLFPLSWSGASSDSPFLTQK